MMKKEFILAGMIVVGVSLVSTSALADTQGTQTFTANISSSTCVITGLNINHDFGSITKQELLAKSDWGEIKHYSDKLSVTGCPASDTTVNIAASYDALPNMGVYGWANNHGSAKGLTVKFFRGDVANPLAPGSNGYDYPLVNGAVDIPIEMSIARVARSITPDADVAAGTVAFDATINVTMK
ncbi:hypothetical protein IO679_004728 [Salmonella enterica subsp. enterica serovar Glostrup]|nr:hypothetical protein [Salmonella enterica subsp. enterica serovar Glostrup]